MPAVYPVGQIATVGYEECLQSSPSKNLRFGLDYMH